MNKNSKILITGSEGMVGKNLIEELSEQGYSNLIFIDKDNLNLINREDTFNFFKCELPEYVFHLASKVGGIKNNLENPVEFLRDNLLINTNIIDASFYSKVKKLIILNSATIYPSKIDFPEETDFSLENLEKENEAYALSKFIAIKLSQYYYKEHGSNFINLISTNIYGKYAKFEFDKSNVVASLIQKFHDAKKQNKDEVLVWGTGNAKREFIFARDLSKLLIESMNKINFENSENGILNCGLNQEYTIKELAEIIKKVVGFEGEIIFDSSKPEGVLRRAMNNEKFKKLINFENKTPILEGLEKTYKYYLQIISSEEK